MSDAFFGSDAQQALLQRSRDMFLVARDDPRFTYDGRTVGFADHTDESQAMVVAFARLQGAAHDDCVEDAEGSPLLHSITPPG